LLGIIAQKTGNRVYSLEHEIYWSEHARKILEKLKIKSVDIFVNPLRSYGNFDWYNPPVERLPDNFSIVICDGPPASISGGRFGLIPVMKDRLSDSIILLDVYSRIEEQTIVKSWQNEVNLSINLLGENGTYAILELN